MFRPRAEMVISKLPSPALLASYFIKTNFGIVKKTAEELCKLNF